MSLNQSFSIKEHRGSKKIFSIILVLGLIRCGNKLYADILTLDVTGAYAFRIVGTVSLRCPIEIELASWFLLKIKNY